jgi:hypothetical protein
MSLPLARIGAGAPPPPPAEESDDALSPDIELITTEQTEPFPVRFEAGLAGRNPVAGPLSAADDLPLTPFELTLRLPAAWSAELYQETAALFLQRFIWRYRAFQAYGQHL